MKLLLFSLLFLSSLAHAQNPVLIELFTSQGCSSCPAADQNLAELIQKAESSGQQVYGLSFHVDYWNYIGWKDPYSQGAFTERQKQYASFMSSENIYTPQMIVNGEKEFVGSDKSRSELEVAKAHQQKMAFEISLNEMRKTGGKILVSYVLNKVPASETINVALVQGNTSNEVTRGENAGKKLAHRNVVRAFGSVAAQKEGNLEIDFPAGVDGVVVFLQNSNWRVTGITYKSL